MLADKIKNLEIAVDEAQAANLRLQNVKTSTQKRVAEAQAFYAQVMAEAKEEVTTAEQVHAVAVQKVNVLRDDVRGFLNDILAGGRVRQ